QTRFGSTCAAVDEASFATTGTFIDPLALSFGGFTTGEMPLLVAVNDEDLVARAGRRGPCFSLKRQRSRASGVGAGRTENRPAKGDNQAEIAEFGDFGRSAHTGDE